MARQEAKPFSHHDGRCGDVCGTITSHQYPERLKESFPDSGVSAEPLPMRLYDFNVEKSLAAMDNPLSRQFDQVRSTLEQMDTVKRALGLTASSSALEYLRSEEERYGELAAKAAGLGAAQDLTSLGSAAEILRLEKERYSDLAKQMSGLGAACDFTSSGSATEILRLEKERYFELTKQAVGLTAIRANELAGLGLVESMMTQLREQETDMMSLYAGSFSTQLRLENALALAGAAKDYSLGSALDPFRTPEAQLSVKLLSLGTLVDAVKSPEYLGLFTHASALADLFDESKRVDRYLQQAAYEFAQTRVPVFPSLHEYGAFLNASGLVLPHWPAVRLLKTGDKKRRFGSLLQKNRESKDVRKGKSLIQRYELALREVLDDVMTTAYGDDWARSRLPLCDCKKLLGRSESRGGHPLDHADYAHYELIMSEPQHFDEIFAAGFDDREALKALIKKAGELRAKLSHFHPFSAEDLRDLRLTWRSIETGLLALLPDYEIE